MHRLQSRNRPCGTRHDRGIEFRLRKRLVGHWKDSRLHYRTAIVSRRWANASVCCFHISQSCDCDTLRQMVSPETVDLLSIYWLICHVILYEILSSKYCLLAFHRSPHYEHLYILHVEEVHAFQFHMLENIVSDIF